MSDEDRDPEKPEDSGRPDPEKPEAKEAESRELTERPEGAQGLTMEQVLQHPVVKEMSARLETLQRTMESLPELIGRAVAEAQKAKRVPGMDIKNPELLTGAGVGKEIPVQDLKAHLEQTRKDVGYKKQSPPKPTKKKK